MLYYVVNMFYLVVLVVLLDGFVIVIGVKLDFGDLRVEVVVYGVCFDELVVGNFEYVVMIG